MLACATFGLCLVWNKFVVQGAAALQQCRLSTTVFVNGDFGKLAVGLSDTTLTDSDGLAMHQREQLINCQMHQSISVSRAPRLPALAAVKCAGLA